MSASQFLVRMLINMRNCAASPLFVGLHFFPGLVSLLTWTCVFAAMRRAGLLPRRMVSFFECGGRGVAPVLSPSLPAQSANTWERVCLCLSPVISIHLLSSSEPHFVYEFSSFVHIAYMFTQFSLRPGFSLLPFLFCSASVL